MAFSVHAPHERLKRCSLLPGKWALSHGFCSFTTANGQLKPSNGEVKTFEKIVRQLPKTFVDFSTYRKRLVRRRFCTIQVSRGKPIPLR